MLDPSRTADRSVPLASKTGPPELPGLIGAVICTRGTPAWARSAPTTPVLRLPVNPSGSPITKMGSPTLTASLGAEGMAFLPESAREYPSAMAEVLRIADVRTVEGVGGRWSRVLAFDLRHLLPLVADEAQGLRWAAIPMGEGTEILGRGPRDEEAHALGARVDATEEGVPLDWTDLNDLAGSVMQTVWGTFVAVRDPAAFAEIPRLFHDEWRYLDRAADRFYELVEIAFQAVDSSFWLVWARDEAVRERIRGAFSDVETAPGTSLDAPSGTGLGPRRE